MLDTNKLFHIVFYSISKQLHDGGIFRAIHKTLEDNIRGPDRMYARFKCRAAGIPANLQQVHTRALTFCLKE